MAVSDNRIPVVWPRLHFLLRVLGLSGLLAILGLLAVELLGTPRGIQWEAVQAYFLSPPEKVRPWLYACIGLVGLAVLAEALSLLGAAAAMRRTASGFSASVQLILVACLFVGVNAWSYSHHWRFDWTRHRLFTLPDDLREDLAKLRQTEETKVIVYQRHKTFGSLTDKPDRYDYAAERKVVEKVRDLVDLLREVGPALRVEVLDVEEEDFDRRLDALTRDNPTLRKAIDEVPENSIFISAGKHVQQMSFNEFYQLDREASKKSQNLVLLGQGEDGRGIRPFVRRIRELEQKRPRVGILVVHELLTTTSVEDAFSLAGLRKALNAQGFDTHDVVIKRGWDSRRLEPAADTVAESKLDRIEAELAGLDEDIRDSREEAEELRKVLADLRPRKGEDEAQRLKELTAKYGRLVLGGTVNAEARKALIGYFERTLEQVEKELADQARERSRLKAELASLDLEGAHELRRFSDIKAKLANTVADCDLLIIPRLTRMSSSGGLIQPRLHSMTPEQADVVKRFLRSGKPVLACLGPINEPAGTRLPPDFGPGGPDPFERLLTDLGFRLGRTTVLFPGDSRAFAERRQDILRQEAPPETPPLDFSDATSVSVADPRVGADKGDEHLLRRGMRVLARSAGGGLDLKLRFARPVYFEPSEGRSEGVFLLTAGSAWNEDRPFPSRDWRPRYTPPKADDPAQKTLEVRRRGAFSVGAAAEAAIPKSWLEEKDGPGNGKNPQAAAASVRVAVIGQGEVFNGLSLTPAKERLLLQTTNWLLGRDDYLPSSEHPHAYPRLVFAGGPLKPDSPIHAYWVWGARAGLPLLFAYLGIVVLLYRRLR
jgi:hypothetical protein